MIVCGTEPWVVYRHKGRVGASNEFFHSWMRPSHRQAMNFWNVHWFWWSPSCPFSSALTNLSLVWLWEWLWTIADLDLSETHWCLEPYLHSVCKCEWQLWIYEYVNQLLKPKLKLGKARLQSLKETPTLKLGINPVLTVTHICVLVNLCRETAMPP